MKTKEKAIFNFLEQEKAKEATPGLLLRVYHKGKKYLDISYGKTSIFYDLASITKVMFTTTRLMMLKENKIFHETDKVKKIIPWFNPSHHFKSLLNHTSGAIPWKPYFKSIPAKFSREDQWSWMQKKLRSEPSFKKTASKTNVYSDVGFLLLGVALEYLESKSLLSSWREVQESFQLEETHFNIDNIQKYKIENYAPTEYCPWRKKQLQGQVSDENAYALGGIAPHAGLFSTLDDTSVWILKLRDIFYGKTHQPISQKTLQTYVQSQSSFGLGFMKPKNSMGGCGKYFSKASFGHTGFSGTSVWFDPQKDLIVILLSNRICPNRDNKKFATLRPLIHNHILKVLNI